MSHNSLKFREELLHQLWVNGAFIQRPLYTETGQGVKILYPGELNNSDGPDFLCAKILIGGLLYHGAVEIHWRSKDWFTHKHHHDKNYENVILHVVAEEGKISTVYTSSGIRPPTINVFQHLPSNFQSFVDHQSENHLPCNGLIRSISPDVFSRQVESAQQEYLDKKVDAFLQYYDQQNISSEAWKRALFITLCDALGVPSNREQMRGIANDLLNRNIPADIDSILKSKALSAWKKKGNRSILVAKQRIKQALILHKFINSNSLDYFFTTSIESIWFEILHSCELSATPHNHRLFISFFLPAMYALGIITHSKKLKNQILKLWTDSEIEVPKSILRKFGIFNRNTNPTTFKRIGLVHQLNAYCKPLQCSRCEVLNKAISS